MKWKVPETVADQPDKQIYLRHIELCVFDEIGCVDMIVTFYDSKTQTKIESRIKRFQNSTPFVNMLEDVPNIYDTSKDWKYMPLNPHAIPSINAARLYRNGGN